MIKILAVFGTRAEVIKMASVIKDLRKHPDEFICRVCVTAHKKVKEEEKREGKVFKLRT